MSTDNGNPERPKVSQNTGDQGAPPNPIDSAEKHQSVIERLKDPFFGLQHLLKDKKTLSPQQVSEIWGNPDTLKALKGFPKSDADEATKSKYLAENPQLKTAIEKTRQILQTQAARETAERGAGEDADTMLAKELGEKPVAEKTTQSEAESTKLTPKDFLVKLGMADVLQKHPEFAKEFETHPHLKQLISLPPKQLDQLLAGSKDKIKAIVEGVLEKTKKKKREEKAETTDAENLDGIKEERKDQEQIRAEIDKYINNPNLTLGQIGEALKILNANPEIRDEKYQVQFRKLTDVQRELNSALGFKAPESQDGKPNSDAAILSDIIGGTPVRWNAPQPTVRYASILSHASFSKLSDAAQSHVYSSFGITRRHPGTMNNAADINREMKAGRGTQKVTKYVRRKNPKTGEWETVKEETEEPIPYDKNNPLEVRDGVEAYPATADGKGMKLRAKSQRNSVEIDVTGWMEQDITTLAEDMQFWAMTENSGVTGFMEDVYKINFSFLNSNFDPATLRRNRQIRSALLGGIEGGDGDIFRTQEFENLIVAQSRLFGISGKAMGDGAALGAYDQSESMRKVRMIGLQNGSGDIDFEVLEEFGRYTREHHMTGELAFEDVQRHLYVSVVRVIWTGWAYL